MKIGERAAVHEAGHVAYGLLFSSAEVTFEKGKHGERDFWVTTMRPGMKGLIDRIALAMVGSMAEQVLYDGMAWDREEFSPWDFGNSERDFALSVSKYSRRVAFDKAEQIALDFLDRFEPNILAIAKRLMDGERVFKSLDLYKH